ncbi:MAG: rhomboid family intramembrane serine protease [Terriglobia bacterium]
MNPASIAPTALSGDPRDRRHFPVVATYVLLALNIFIFVLMTLSGGSQNVYVLLDFGASYGPFFRVGEYWRLVMPMFLHIGWEHLLTNMFALWLLGSFLEPLYGYGRFALLYVLSGMGGSLLSMEASPHIAAGASGAIFGVAGAMLVTGLLHPETVPRRWKNVFGIGILLVIILNLVFGHFVRHIDNWAHLGGLVVGLILAWMIPPARVAARAWARSRVQPILILPVAIVIVAAAAAANHSFKTRQATRLLEDAAKLETAGKPAQARDALGQARSLEPHDVRVREALGFLYLQERDYDKAIPEFQAALRVNPFATSNAISLAAAYKGKNDWVKARDVLEASVQRVPRSAVTLESLAEVCSRLKLYSEAIERYNEALSVAPDFAVAQNNLAWLYATCDDARYRDPAKALKHATRAVQLTQSREPGVIDTLAAALSVNGRLDLAVQAEAKAVALDPQNPVYQRNLIRYRVLAGK